MRLKWVALAAIGLACLGLVLFLYRRAAAPSPAARIQSLASSPIRSPAAQSFAVLFGIGDTGGFYWSGGVAATGANILNLQGWRFTTPDAITGTSFQFYTRLASSSGSSASSYLEENGVIVTATDNGSPATFTVNYCAVASPASPCNSPGTFSFTPQQVPFGTPLSSLGGRILVYQVPSPVQLTNSMEEDDYPSIAQSGDDVYLAYTQFVHGTPRIEAQPLHIKLATDLCAALSPPPCPAPDFSILGRPAGGDQVLMLHYSKSKRVWTGPFPITSPGEDAMRTAVAVDGTGLAWVFYSTQRSGNFDLYARSVTASGATSAELRLTTDAGPDLWPVAATDPTSGRVWVAWQGFRNNNLEILAAAQQGSSFTPEAVVSFSPASDWDPAIAAAPNGEVAIAWDTYDKGDYDVYVRRVHFGTGITMDPPIPVATSANFEARASIAYNASSVLWVAYELSGPLWGKDYGAYDTTGIPLYQNHTIETRFLVGNNVFAPSDDVKRVLPGPPAAQMLPPAPNTTTLTQPDPTIATGRAAGGNILHGGGLANSFPRLTTDGGTVYLAYRVFNGLGDSTSQATDATVGSIWSEQMVYFDGSEWHGPGVFADSDGLLDNNPAMLSPAAGRLLIAQPMDHRLSPLPGGTPAIDGVNSDIYALELQIPAGSAAAARPPAPVQAVRGAPDARAAGEAKTAASLRNFRITVNGQTLQLMRGDFHRHTDLSFDGHADGALVDAYRYGIDTAALNWFSCCDHENGGSREYSWWLAQKYTDAYLLGTTFVPVFYYERSLDYPRGHRNIMFEKRGVRPLPNLPYDKTATKQPDTAFLYQYLKYFTSQGNRGRTASHTSATTQGTDWADNSPDLEPIVEIYQGDRQSYEGCPEITIDPCTLPPPTLPYPARSNSSADSISGYKEKGAVSRALSEKGYLLGFEASSDHVSTHIAFTNVWAANPTRSGILDAVSARHTYGSTDYIVADFRSGTHFMGDKFPAPASSPPVFSVALEGTNTFDNIVIVKDNAVVYSTCTAVKPCPAKISFTWQDHTAKAGTTSYYYVRGQQTKVSTPPLQVQAQGEVVWVSPMWVQYQ